MANLAEAVTADKTDWIISADLDDDIDFLTVEDEIVHVTANFPAQLDPQTRVMGVPRIRVERGAGGTTAATHADTTVLTALIPPAAAGGGGGAIAVTDGTTTIDPTTALTVSSVTEGGAGEAIIGTLPPGMTYDEADARLDIATPVQGFRWPTAVPGNDPRLDILAALFQMRGNAAHVEISNEDGSVVVFSTDAGVGTAIYTDASQQFWVRGNSDGNIYIRVTTTGQVMLPTLPSADPAVAGQVYTDGVPSAGVPRALKVSGG